ncbi:putative Protein phosphatase 2C [Blattamonas nauphoetae]|uniref:PPM-type phosphatase domain-containing protein n=1 Tax=Blattamonas nauphoetae TaxID=2049346 RepID=A0ABQ9Y661_9EUKA|nr:putative Protein phosphatase 2C [Blattamonas nauphoetae]
MINEGCRPLIKDYGFSDELNPRYRRTMEDAHCFHDNVGPHKNFAICAIYDGHGGREAVDFVSMNFHRVFTKLLHDFPSEPLESILRETFKQTDALLLESNILDDGTTAAVVVINRQVENDKEVVRIVSANCGDARAVLIHNGQSKRISSDHKPSQDSEIERIQKTGCLMVQNRVGGVLAVSRALGDHGLKDAVISDPFVSEHILEEEGVTHLIVACDGIWDVLEDEEAAEIVERNLSNCQAASFDLLKTALDKGSMDNISVMVVRLSDAYEQHKEFQLDIHRNSLEDEFLLADSPQSPSEDIVDMKSPSPLTPASGYAIISSSSSENSLSPVLTTPSDANSTSQTLTSSSPNSNNPDNSGPSLKNGFSLPSKQKPTPPAPPPSQPDL